MAKLMKKVNYKVIEKELGNWGKAELTDKWVVLHKKGGAKWAIYFREKPPSVVVPYRTLKSHKKKMAKKPN